MSVRNRPSIRCRKFPALSPRPKPPSVTTAAWSFATPARSNSPASWLKRNTTLTSGVSASPSPRPSAPPSAPEPCQRSSPLAQVRTRCLASGLLSNWQLIRLASRGGRNRSSTRLPVLGRQLRKRGLAPAPFFISIGGFAVPVKRLPGIPRPIRGWSQVSREWKSRIEPRRTRFRWLVVSPCRAQSCLQYPRNTRPRRSLLLNFRLQTKQSPIPDPYYSQLLSVNEEPERMSGRWGDRPLGRGDGRYRNLKSIQFF